MLRSLARLTRARSFLKAMLSFYAPAVLHAGLGEDRANSVVGPEALGTSRVGTCYERPTLPT